MKQIKQVKTGKISASLCINRLVPAMGNFTSEGMSCWGGGGASISTEEYHFILIFFNGA